MTAPAIPGIVLGRVRHDRLHPVKHRLRYRAHQWLVDVDHPDVAPRWLSPLASFQPRDHVGGDHGTLGANVRAFIAAHDVDWTAHKVLMMANARVLGYVFDPLSVFWCFASDGNLEGVLAEVHNTYGERHGYLLQLDSGGVGRTGKDFYVSPFFAVSGDYQLRFTLDDDRIGAYVALRQGGRVVFTASFTGRPVPATTGQIIRVALTQPLMPQRVSALIRLHGIWLWLRRLPVVPR